MACRRLARLASGVLLTLVAAAHGSMQAQELSDRTLAKKEVSNAERPSAMQFARENHPELARLLEQLEKSRPGEFARATKELNQQIQRLEKTREKSPARYAEQLEAWKQDSQIRIQIARWSLSRDSDLEQHIRTLLKERRRKKAEQLRADQKRLSEQLAKISEQLAAMSDSIDAQVDLEWEQLSTKAAAGKKSQDNKSSKQPAAATGATKQQ